MIKLNKEKNKFALVTIQVAKECIEKGKQPLYNPIVLCGGNRLLRARIYFLFFNKEFNQKYSGRRISCKNIKEEEEVKNLLILEEVECLVNDRKKQERVNKLLNRCIKENVQVLIGYDKPLEELAIQENLKCNIGSGIIVYIEE